MTAELPEVTWGTTLLSGLIALAVTCVLVYSLIARRIPWELESAGLLARLRKRKDQLLRAIKDAEYGRQSGALSDEELQGLRNSLKQRAIQVTRDMESLRKVRFKSLLRKGRGGVTPSQRKHLEGLVASRLAKMGENPPAPAKGESH